jgi:hypothetical protein
MSHTAPSPFDRFPSGVLRALSPIIFTTCFTRSNLRRRAVLPTMMAVLPAGAGEHVYPTGVGSGADHDGAAADTLCRNPERPGRFFPVVPNTVAYSVE